MNKILVLRNKPLFKGLFIHLIGYEHEQDLGPPFFHVIKLVGHLSTFLEKTPIGNSTVTYTTIFAQRSGVSRTLWVPLEPMLNRHFSSRYLDVLCSTDQHDFTFIGEIRCNTNA